MRNSKLVAALAAALLAGSAAHVAAQPAGNQAQAEQLYNEADALFQVRKYDEAAAKFILAYEAWPVTEFLYNIAQSYRLAGNCKDALYFYQRFKKLKFRDDGKDLSETDPRRAERIDRFIEELEACVKTQNDDPRDTTKPDGTSNNPDATDPGTGTDTGTVTGTGTDVAVAPDGEDDQDEDDDLILEDETALGVPTTVSARAVGGIALVGAGDADVPVQPIFGVVVGYPLAAGPLVLDAGAAFSFTPLPYRDHMNASQQATMVTALANVGATYPVTPQIGVRGDLGLGLMTLGGLGPGNPFTMGGATTDGALAMFHLRVGVSADYAITPNLVATVAPLSFGYSPAKEGLHADAITALSFFVGVGYRM